MKRFSVLYVQLAASLAIVTPSVCAQQGSVNVICGVQIEWCNAVQAAFARETGIKVNMVKKSTGDAFEQLSAEKSDPRIDVWFGGTGDSHLQAAENDLTLPYQSPNIHLLRDWAVNQAEKANYKTVGIYAGPLGFAYNTEVLERKKLPIPLCWSDLIKPEYKGEIQMANPHSSGTAFTAIATLVQLSGEEKAFKYLKALHGNINQYPREGSTPLKNTAQGKNAISISFIHDVPGEVIDGFPVKGVMPCEGTGYEIGSMSIIKGARNIVNAKRFYDWALTAPAQELAAQAKQFQLPANQRAKVDSRVPDIKRLKLINYDFGKYGSTEVRYRLLDKWQNEVGKLP